MKQPLNWENATDKDDFIDFYNPNKGPKPGAYAQIRSRRLDGGSSGGSSGSSGASGWAARNLSSNWAL